jgi:hypothetical protein
MMPSAVTIMGDINTAIQVLETFGCNRNKLPDPDISSWSKSETAVAEMANCANGATGVQIRGSALCPPMQNDDSKSYIGKQRPSMRTLRCPSHGEAADGHAMSSQTFPFPVPIDCTNCRRCSQP